MTSGPGEQQDDGRAAALLLRVWSEPGAPATLRARLVDAAGPDAGATFSTAVGTADIGREVLRWLGTLTSGPAAPPVPAPAAPPLVGTGWLAEHRNDPDLAVLEVGDDPGSRQRPGWLDWNEDLHPRDGRGVVDAAALAATMDRLGVGADDHLVLAGSEGPALAASAFWCLAYHAHRRLSLLDGGLARWVAEGRDRADAVRARPPRTGYRPGSPRREILATREQLLGGLVGAPPGTALVDCRTRDEFAGRPRHPYDRPTDRHRLTGHIPGAVNLPSEDLLDEHGLLLDAVHIGRMCAALGLAPADQVVVHCGVNDRSTLVWFALTQLLGWPDVRCYQGGWAEYGSLTDSTAARGT